MITLRQLAVVLLVILSLYVLGQVLVRCSSSYMELTADGFKPSAYRERI